MKVKPKKPAYMQANLELAQENGQLKLELGQIRTQNAKQNEKIFELKSQVTELSSIKEKYDHIVRIVLDIGTSMSASHASTSESSVCSSQSLREEPIHNPSMIDSEGGDDPNVTRDMNRTENLDKISEKSAEDSLQPAEVTSVTPLRPERMQIHTPSIWAVLDETTGDRDQGGRRTQTIDKGSIQELEKDGEIIQQDMLNHATMIVQNGTTNSASPIQPIGAHRILSQNSIFHSTPVFNTKGPCPQNLENQENLAQQDKHHVSTIQQSESSIPVASIHHEPAKSPEKPKSRGRKRQAKATKPNSAIEEQSEGPSRYNLRKRSKQQV